MKKLFRLTLLCLVCLVLLLGTDTFRIATETNAAAPWVVFSFTQTAPGMADVEVFGHDMTWNLTPVLTLREAFTDTLAAIPAKLFAAACSFLETIFAAFA